MIALMFRSFGVEPPVVVGPSAGALWIVALLFVAASLIILAFINFFSLMIGVTMNFLGRDGVKFRFIQLFRRIPLIGVTLPVLFGYAVWHNAASTGAMTIAIPSILILVAAIALLAVIIVANGQAGRRTPQ